MGLCREAGILDGRAAGRERERLKDFRNLGGGWMRLRRVEDYLKEVGHAPAPRCLRALT